MALLFTRLLIGIGLMGVVITLIPFTYPRLEMAFVATDTNVATNIVTPINHRYLELTLEGTNFSSRVGLFKLLPGDSLLNLYNETYVSAFVLPIEPGIYIIQILIFHASSPLRVSVIAFDPPVKQVCEGSSIALISAIAILLRFMHQRRIPRAGPR